MDFKFHCPYCATLLKPDKEHAGRIIPCSSCGRLVEVPGTQIDESPPIAAPAAGGPEEFQFLPAVQPAQSTEPSIQAPSATALPEKFGIRQWVGIVGAMVLFVGVFTPILSIPIMGNMNYFQNGEGLGTIVLILAVLSLVAIFIRKDVILFFTSLGCLGTITFSFMNVKIGINRMLAEASSSDDLFFGLAQAAAEAVQLQWGWPLLIVGGGLTLAPIFMKSTPEDDSQHEFFKLGTRWRLAAGVLSALCVVAVITVQVWPTTASTSTGLENLFSSEPDDPAEPPKKIPPAEPPKKIPSVPLGSIVIDEVKLTIHGVRCDHIERESMFGDSTTRSDGKYLLVDLTLQNTSPGRIIYLKDIWNSTKLIDNFNNVEGEVFSSLFSFSSDDIVGYVSSAKLMPGDTRNDMMIFDLPVDAAQSFRIESDPGFWKNVSESEIQELSNSSFKIEFRRNQIRWK